MSKKDNVMSQFIGSIPGIKKWGKGTKKQIGTTHSRDARKLTCIGIVGQDYAGHLCKKRRGGGMHRILDALYARVPYVRDYAEMFKLDSWIDISSFHILKRRCK